MRVLLIGQKIVTLEDLNSYFFEQHIHGYACVGAPNMLSLDIVRYSGIHMVICQSSDYSMEHLTTFMNRVKKHDVTIVTLLISESIELSQLKESELNNIDDLLVLPFTPSEFHTRLLKLILKSNSPHSKSNTEDWLKSMLSLVSDSQGADIKSKLEETSEAIKSGFEEDEYFIPDLNILKRDALYKNINSEKLDTNDNSINLDVDKSYDEFSQLDSRNEGHAQANLEKQNFAGLTPAETSAETIPSETQSKSTTSSNNAVIAENSSALDDIDKRTSNLSGPWIDDPTRFAELMDGIDFENAPIANRFAETDYAISSNTGISSALIMKETAISENQIKSDKETKEESTFNKILEYVGRVIYFILVLFLILFSIVVVKSYYDGGVATFGKLGLYSNTSEFLYEKGNLVKGSFPGALIASYGVGPANPFGENVIAVLPWLGYIADFSKTPIGFLIIIVIPLLIIFVVEIYYWIQRRKNKTNMS